MLRATCVTVCLIAGPLASLAGAATYQVGPTRSYQQLSQVATILNPGDIVEVDGNATYGPVTFDRPGTAAAPITIRGIRVNGVRPRLSGSDSSGFTLYMRTRNTQMGYYTVEGFEITGGSQACIRNQARDVTYRDIKVYSCARHGLLSHDYNSGNLTISFAEFTGIGGTYAGENLKHPVYIVTSQDVLPGSKCRIEYSYIHDNISGNNVKSRCERNEVYYNWFQGGEYYELEMIGPDVGTSGVGRSCHSDVVGNVIFSHHAYPIRMGSDGRDNTFGRYRFVNNTIIAMNAGGGGITRHLGVIESIEFINNIIYASPSSELRLHRVDGTWLTGSEVITGRNNWISSNVSMSLASGAGAAVLSGAMRGSDPGFTNASSTSTFDPRLVAGSVAINAGTASLTGSNGYPVPSPLTSVGNHPTYRLGRQFTTVTAETRPVNGALDVGAFEYGAAAPVTPPAAPTNLRIVSQ